MHEMRLEGILQRMGAVFDSKKVGFVRTLCAARVPEKLKVLVEVVNSYAGVTHRKEHYRLNRKGSGKNGPSPYNRG